MPLRLDSRSADFAARFAAFLATKRETAEDVEQTLRGIIA
jgi:histidinol dehydrogenase